MTYDIQHISRLMKGNLVAFDPGSTISYLLTDSRKLVFPAETLFFAISTNRRDGHEYIDALYEKGVRNFVVNALPQDGSATNSNFIIVPDTITALQQLALAHRHRFDIPVFGITGSNGKTIVKEWLNQLLEPDFVVVRSPASYNSQIGIPMSVWLMNNHSQVAIFEAGISTTGEMQKAQPIIDPTIGIFTNIGEAHSEGFSGLEQKISEKLLLFKDAGTLIYRKDQALVDKLINDLQKKSTRLFSWGEKDDSTFRILSLTRKSNNTDVVAVYDNREFAFNLPFADDASVENTIHCFCAMLCMGVETSVIISRIRGLAPVAMRLELKSGINNSSVINDSYSSDLSSLRIALDFLSQQKQHPQKTVILSDILESGLQTDILYRQVADLLKQYDINRLIGIGQVITSNAAAFSVLRSEVVFFDSVDEFRKSFASMRFGDETILIKGARVFQLESIDSLLQQKVHQTVLEIDLNAVVHNLNEYRKLLTPGTKVMAMVKAFSYGSGSFEIANVLQFHKVNYLAVAYTDEGVALRKGGISLPIMVMNTDAAAFDTLVQYNLEPDLYSPEIFDQFTRYLLQIQASDYPVHLEMETGMNRLGFSSEDLPPMLEALRKYARPGVEKKPLFRVKSVYSHLAASEDPDFDEFTHGQFTRFESMTKDVEAALGYPALKHITNSAGTSRYKGFGLDMVRIGIGLYGVDPGMDGKADLKEVSSLKTT
ncbi:MAG: bifunctional UDP-N-acetylmuramoyl-tripeptide:D-alanyl-D-alanine ligase/alanine racemase, partial [Flavitalea sp.]